LRKKLEKIKKEKRRETKGKEKREKGRKKTIFFLTSIKQGRKQRICTRYRYLRLGKKCKPQQK
jgi:hypothetical protein